MDYHKLTRDTFKLIRNETSQRTLSENLGYSFNKVGKIESGQTSIKWKDFLNTLEILNFPIKEHLKTFFYYYDNTDWLSPKLGEYLYKEYALSTLDSVQAKKLSKKLLTKFDNIDLADIFSVLDSRPSMLIGFLIPIIDVSQIHELEKDFEIYEQSVNIISENPAIAFINCSLVVKEYLQKEKHCDQTLALHADCSIETVHEIFRLNKTLNIFPFNGTHYEPSQLNFSFSNLANDKLRKFNKYTLQKTADKFIIDRSKADTSKVYNSGHASVRAIALSTEAAEKVSKLLASVHMQISQIVKEDEGNEHSNLQLICLTSVPSTVKEKSPQ